MGCQTAEQFKLGACPGQAGAAGTTAAQVKQSLIGAAATIIGGALLGPAVGLLDGTVAEGASAAEGAAEEGAAEEGAGNAVKDAAESCLGGESFTASTKVLLASGATIPISQLRPGMKVLATSTRTGKTEPETVAAVLVNHDTDLYDLKIRAGSKTAVIETTSDHLFWVAGNNGHGGRWVKARTLRYGTHLRTPGGGILTVTGGWAPKNTTGRMWDLSIPGDRDFYIDTVVASVLVHNCPTENKPLPRYKQCIIAIYNALATIAGGTNMADEPLPTSISSEYRDQHPTSGQGPMPPSNPSSGGGTSPGGPGGSGNQGCS